MSAVEGNSAITLNRLYKDVARETTGSHDTGDKRVSVVCLGGEIFWPGFSVEIASVVKLQAVCVFIYVSR